MAALGCEPLQIYYYLYDIYPHFYTCKLWEQRCQAMGHSMHMQLQGLRQWLRLHKRPLRTETCESGSLVLHCFCLELFMRMLEFEYKHWNTWVIQYYTCDDSLLELSGKGISGPNLENVD